MQLTHLGKINISLIKIVQYHTKAELLNLILLYSFKHLLLTLKGQEM